MIRIVIHIVIHIVNRVMTVKMVVIMMVIKIFTHIHREELILTKKPVYTYEELIVYLHNLDSIWESKIKNKLKCDSYFN